MPPSVLEHLPYNITSFADPLGGATFFPFLEQTKRAWRILTQPVGELAEPYPAHTFGKAGEPRPPTLRWVSGDLVSDLYVDGLTTEQFLEATGLKLDLHKGGFVLSKRMSRIMRSHFVSGFFAPEDVKMAYMQQTPGEAKVWDGAGLVLRQMIRKIMFSDVLSPAKQERPVETELHYAQRVEFTVMTERGQGKGHAIVAENLRDENGRPVDLLLPQDTRKEVRMENDHNTLAVSPPSPLPKTPLPHSQIAKLKALLATLTIHNCNGRSPTPKQ